MRNIKSKFFLTIFFITLIGGIFLRLYNLEKLPIFHDEAIYLLTTRKIEFFKMSTWGRSFQGVTQKPPLIFLFTSFFMQDNDSDLLRARGLSVFFGILTALVAYLVALNLFGKKGALLSWILFSFSPFLVFYQRLFIVESFLLFFVLFTILVFQYSLEKESIFLKTILVILGFLLTAIKQSVFLWMPSVFLFPLLNQRKIGFRKLTRSIFFILLGLLSGFIFFELLVGFEVYFIPKENFITETLSSSVVIKNLLAIAVWVKSYLTNSGFFIVLAVILFSFIIRILKGKQRRYFLFLFLILLPVFLQIFIAKYFFARYIFVSFALGLIFIAQELNYLYTRYTRFSFLVIFLFTVLVIQALLFSVKIATDITNAPLHENEKWQYFSGWPSGWGVKEISQFVARDKNLKRIASIGEGMMPTNGLRFYLEPKGIEVVAYPKDVKVELIKEEFLVFQEDDDESLTFKESFKPKIVIDKPEGKTKIGLYFLRHPEAKPKDL